MEAISNLKSQSIKLQERKAAIYCRVASSQPNDAGAIGIQLDKLRSFAKEHGYNVFMEYLDDGYSGNNLNRPAFTQMEADINSGKIDTVIVRCIDRIARDMLIREKWISDSNEKGISVIALDGSHEQPSFVEGLLELMQAM